MKEQIHWDFQQKLRLAILFKKMIVVFLEEMHYGFLIVKIGLQMVIGHRQNIHQL